jgi:diguanylate cyclase (GGDEF)-like protein
MVASGGKEIPFEVKHVFLRELDAGYRLARVHYDKLLAAPDDSSSLIALRTFFHRIAGTAENVGLGWVGRLASISENVLDAVLESQFQAPSKVAQMMSDALAAIGLVLDQHGLTDDRPLISTPPRAAVAGTLQPSNLPGERVLSKVLVIDDDIFSATLIDTCLRQAGLISSYCSQPSEALATIQKENPDLVILDVQMPGIDGFDLCRRIRALPALQFTPIIFVTRRGDVAQRVRGLEVGGNDYIAKPFEPEELVARVRSHLERLATMRDMAIRDGLTRCFNHRFFKMRLETEVARATRYESCLALAMMDVDFFKRINDTHGHPSGDIVLIDLSSLLSASVRSTDVVARYGGEEFVILFLEAGAKEAAIITNRIRDRIAHHPFSVPGLSGTEEATNIHVTVSFGIAELRKDETAESLLGRTDRALYAAKDGGRNQVHVSEG